MVGVYHSVNWKNARWNIRIFIKFDIWVIFENLSRKFKFNWNLTWRPIYSFDHTFFNSSYNEKCFRYIAEKITTHILCSITSFKNHAFYEIMWKNTVQSGRPQVTIWCTCIACWIPKATNTNSEHAILIAFPLQQWLHKRTSMLCLHTLPVLLKAQDKIWRKKCCK